MNLILLKKIFYCFFLFLCFAASAFGRESVKITVHEISPAPNYHLCTDEKDIEQLTDGEIERYPIWIRKGCVGWNQKGAVAISFSLSQNRIEKMSGALRIHTAKGIHAGVKPPARIDVYIKKDNGNFFHVFGKTIDANSMNDRASHWITLDVEDVASSMLIILRPNGSYLFVDEIQWEAGAATTRRSHVLVGDMQACQKDSMERYRKSLTEQKSIASQTIEEWHNFLGKRKITAWVEENPFSHLQTQPLAKFVSQSPRHLQLLGTTSELESGCVGILNSGESDEIIKVNFEGETQVTDHISLAQVDKVLAANGKTVYDPLLSIKEAEAIHLHPRQASYIWLQADLQRMLPGKYNIKLIIQDRQGKILEEVPVNITVVAKKLQEDRRPAAINWAYTNDKPIFRQPDKAVLDLVAHGVNVFVIHPANIPMPSLDGNWDIIKARKFVRDLKLYHGKGKILLFLGWGIKNGRPRIPPLENVETKKQKNIIQNWVHQLVKFLEENNIPKSDWLLYPVDEPNGAELDFLLKISKWIKEADNEVQIYANPISTHSNVTTAAELSSLNLFVDIWQPSLNLAKRLNYFFNNLKKSWWVYAGSGSPAKASSPWEEYRLLAWRSWAVGAKGVGFWSYSDTSGTTAWDDLDGRRPDFAVVYEDSKGPISSRRWEAFREGIEDFQLLESVMHGDFTSSMIIADTLKIRVKEILNNPITSFAAVTTLRKEILTANENAYQGSDN